MKEITKIVLEEIGLINQKLLPGYDMTPDMIRDGIRCTPAELYKYYSDNGYPPTKINSEQAIRYMFCLCSDNRRFKFDKGFITPSTGFLKYVSDEPWYNEMISSENNMKSAKIRYYDQSCSHLFVKYKNKYHMVPLAKKCENLHEYSFMTWMEYDYLRKRYAPVQKETKEAALLKQVKTEQKIRDIVEEAKQKHGDEKNNAKNIKQNRRTARALSAKEGIEMRSAILDSGNIEKLEDNEPLVIDGDYHEISIEENQEITANDEVKDGALYDDSWLTDDLLCRFSDNELAEIIAANHELQDAERMSCDKAIINQKRKRFLTLLG